MKVHIDQQGTPASLETLLRTALDDGPAGSLLVLACDENGFTPQTIDPILKAIDVPVFGGIFPSIISEGEQVCRGAVVVSMQSRAKVYHVPGLSDSAADFEDILDAQLGDEEFKTLLVFLDGLSTRIRAFVEALYAEFGLEINYVGGGAGSSDLKNKPCIITNQGLKADCAVLAALDLNSGVGVRHGWISISGPYQVTESERNVIKSLDWKPAFDVYKAIVEAHSGKRFDVLDFFDLAMAYPFGIAKMGSETVVRDPLSVDSQGNLICVGEVPVGEYVDILHGKPNALIEAAGRAKDLAWADFPETRSPGLSLFIDCLSRMLFLGEGYGAEIDAVWSAAAPSLGICTIGEIANSGRDYLEFYNKTSVVVVLEDG